jgi:hypothetical protein
MGLPISIVEVIGGTTLRATWINSGVAPSSLSSALLDSDDVAVNTFVATASGNGHYFAVHYVPTSAPWYVNRWIAFIEGNTYQHRQLVRAHKLEV